MGAPDSSGGSDTDEDDSDSGGFLSGIVNGINSIIEKIRNLPSLIADGLSSFFENIVTAVQAIPEGIKAVFIPDSEYVTERIDELKEDFARLTGGTVDLSPILTQEKPLEDIEITIYGTTVTIVDMDLVDVGLNKFRPVIRGLMCLMILIYNVNQFFSLIGQSPLSLGMFVPGSDSSKDRPKGGSKVDT